MKFQGALQYKLTLNLAPQTYITEKEKKIYVTAAMLLTKHYSCTTFVLLYVWYSSLYAINNNDNINNVVL